MNDYFNPYLTSCIVGEAWNEVRRIYEIKKILADVRMEAVIVIPNPLD